MSDESILHFDVQVLKSDEKPIDDGMVPRRRLPLRFLFNSISIGRIRISTFDVEAPYVQASDGVTRALNTKPVVDARIAIQPVGVVIPVGSIGSVIKVHESLTCLPSS